MNGLEEILEDVLKQYQCVGYQTQVLRLKNTGEVLVSLRMGRVIANMKISMRDQIELRNFFTKPCRFRYFATPLTPSLV